jgi:hypothetical protein
MQEPPRAVPPEDLELMGPIVGYLTRRLHGRLEPDEVLTLVWMGVQYARRRWTASRGPWVRWARTRAKYFVLDAIRESASVVLVEGVMDVLSLYEAGFHNVLATMGTHITQDQMQRVMKYATKMTLAYDNDKAGNGFMLELLSRDPAVVAKRKWWHRVENMFNVDVLQLPAGKDPGDLRPNELRSCSILAPQTWLNELATNGRL